MAADRQDDITYLDSTEIDTPASAVVRPRKSGRGRAGMPTHLSLPRQVMVLATWPFIEQVLRLIVSAVDTGLAGHMGKQAGEATSAVGAGVYYIWLLGLIQDSLGIGATALISRAIGARHRREASSALGQAITLSIVTGIGFAVVSYFIAPLFAHVAGLDGERHTMCVQYLRIMSMAAPFMTVLFVGAAALRGAGDFRSASAIMAVVNVVNFALTFTFVRELGWGVPGIAFGTALAWVTGSLIMFALLLRGSCGLTLHPHRMPLHKAMFKRLVAVGVPSLAENVAVVWLANGIFVLYVVGHLGVADYMGAHRIAITLESFSYTAGVVFGMTAATMVGQYLGAKQPLMARKAAWTCWLFGAAYMTSMGVLFFFFPQAFARQMVNASEAPVLMNSAAQALHIASYGQIGFACTLILAGALKGAGDTRATMIIMLVSTYGFRVPGVWLMGIYLGKGLAGVWMVLAAEQLIRGGIFLGRFLHGGWMKIKV